MNLQDTKELLKEKFKVELFSFEEVNRCVSTCDEIYIGAYTNPEYELISIFHELGHKHLEKDFPKKVYYNTLLIELECWRVGILLANDLHIFFTDDAIQWGMQQALTYVGHDEREYRFYDKSKFWVNKNDTDNK